MTKASTRQQRWKALCSRFANYAELLADPVRIAIATLVVLVTEDAIATLVVYYY
ncbi:hypothetical protein [Coleofasciculus sp. H7-2]|uniref:hypothetical protein n=1 Tax=Coleofasciculus sp. H7-2 TaxID=3351545 RepID=UPI003671D447